MSHVTGVTVILTDWADKARFEALVQRHAAFTPEVAEPSGPNYTDSDTYVLGLDYAGPDLIEAIVAGPWASGSVVFVWDESWFRPQVTVFGADPVGGQPATPEVAL